MSCFEVLDSVPNDLMVTLLAHGAAAADSSAKNTVVSQFLDW